MLERLKSRWKVNGRQVILILCVFAITGTVTAYLSRRVPGWMGLNIETPFVIRLLVRLAVLLFGYQLIILLVALPFGQFPFFWNYEKRLLRWFGRRLGVNPSQEREVEKEG